MPLIAWFVIVHLVADFLLQTDSMAAGKAKGPFWNWALWSHCLTYAAAFVPVFYSCGVPLIASLVALATLLVSHAVLDRRWLVVWWRRRIHGATDEAIRNTWWLNVVIDQVFHLTILCVIAAGLV